MSSEFRLNCSWVLFLVSGLNAVGVFYSAVKSIVKHFFSSTNISLSSNNSPPAVLLVPFCTSLGHPMGYYLEHVFVSAIIYGEYMEWNPNVKSNCSSPPSPLPHFIMLHLWEYMGAFLMDLSQECCEYEKTA